MTVKIGYSGSNIIAIQHILNCGTADREQKKYFRNNNTTQKFTIITGFAKIYYTSLC